MEQQILDRRVNPADETISFAGLVVHFLVTEKESGGSVAAFEMTVAGGKKLPGPAHSHSHYEETIYGIEGAVVFTVDGKEIELGPGQILCIPRGAVHRFENRTDKDAKVLCVITPAAIVPEYFREVRDVLVAAAAAGGPPDRMKMMEIMQRHGLVPEKQ